MKYTAFLYNISVLDIDTLYQYVGRRIRDRRVSSPQKLSQQRLADQLGISRASIVNIEAGRQHAPLHLLWQIADALGVDVIQLIPRHDDMVSKPTNVPLSLDQLDLDKEAITQIKNLVPDPAEQALLAGFLGDKSSSSQAAAKKMSPKGTR